MPYAILSYILKEKRRNGPLLEQLDIFSSADKGGPQPAYDTPVNELLCEPCILRKTCVKWSAVARLIGFAIPVLLQSNCDGVR